MIQFKKIIKIGTFIFISFFLILLLTLVIQNRYYIKAYNIDDVLSEKENEVFTKYLNSMDNDERVRYENLKKSYCKQKGIDFISDKEFASKRVRSELLDTSKINYKKRITTFAYKSESSDEKISDIGNYLGSSWKKESESYIGRYDKNTDELFPINTELDYYPFNSEECKKAREKNNISHYGGCSSFAIINQLYFLSSIKKYSSILRYPHISEKFSSDPRYDEMKNYAREKRIEMMSNIYKTLKVHGDNDSGIYAYPSEVYDSMYSTLSKYNIEKAFDINYSWAIDLRYQHKIDNIEKSIEEGIPAIVWTKTIGKSLSGHYFNIFGKEIWSDGSSARTFYKVWNNYGNSFSDSFEYIEKNELMQYAHWGVITVKEKYSKNISINPEDYNFNYRYYNYNRETTHYFDGTKFIINRFRTAYINEKASSGKSFFDNYLTLSSLRTFKDGNRCDSAEIKYKSQNKNKALSLSLAIWNQYDLFDSDNKIVIRLINSTNFKSQVHEIEVNKISTNKNELTNLFFAFDESFDLLNIEVLQKGIFTTNNRGRVVIGSIKFFEAN